MREDNSILGVPGPGGFVWPLRKIVAVEGAVKNLGYGVFLFYSGWSIFDD